MAAPFDLDRRELEGAPVAILDGVYQDVNFAINHSDKGGGQFSFSSTGWLAYVPGDVSPLPETHLLWVDREGKTTRLEAPTGSYWSPRISDDGRRVAVNKDLEEIWTHDISGRTWSRVSSPDHTDGELTWSPDNEITFESYREGVAADIYLLVLGEGGVPQRLTTAGSFTPVSWAPDGDVLALVRQRTDRSDDIWMLPKGRKAEPFLESPSTLWWPEFSPDGRWLAYGTGLDETGRSEVYVVPYPRGAPRIQISTDGAAPSWGPDGRELFFQRTIGPVHPDGVKEMVVVPVDYEESELRLGEARVLFRIAMRLAVPSRSYDVTPDGQKFLIVQQPNREWPPSSEVRLVVNWFEELERLVPVND